MEQYIFWVGLILLILEFLGRMIPDVRFTGPIGYIINGLKVLLVLLKKISDYLNRESEDQKEMKKSRY